MEAICIIGSGKGSGKTTVIKALIRELSARGYRVATVKHIECHIDLRGKDTWDHAQAGATTVAAIAPREFAVIRYGSQATLDEALEAVSSNADIVLVEGFKGSNLPKIVCLTEARPVPQGFRGALVAAVVTPSTPSALKGSLDPSTPIFSIDNLKGLADIIEGRIAPKAPEA